MKKLIFIVAALCGIILCSSKCDNDTPVLTNNEINVENTISIDRQDVYLNHGEEYRWYETGIQLVNFLDEDSDGAIELVVNVFQVIEQHDSTSFDTFVFKYQHTLEGTTSEAIHGFWIEDYPLNDEVIKVSFNEAFEKIQEVNYPKPHTRQVVLRKQVGPVDANPQWIFGNLHSQLYVDAVTGDVTDKNPAFGGLNLGTPLGEWP